ncbi:putative transcriptional regulator [Frankia sp. EI5c]|uniref:PadR family transcriptional regulator n=1 Tax=Frankia sp. EI5c TaxID=683316 RepID=UPI0007C2583A|nr:helix-turn-helix transcriptional regulator [Frankia sp. EI5c]OAA27804.1 putative transcriptional regulator [Frankia sp. EI5c]
MTLPTQLVLRALLERPLQPMYGLELSQAAGLATGTIHPILARLEGCGWLTSEWEDIDPKVEGRPRRRYYQLSVDGVEQARYALAHAHSSISRIGALLPRVAEGGSR